MTVNGEGLGSKGLVVFGEQKMKKKHARVSDIVRDCIDIVFYVYAHTK